jgi:hypothetical protein
MLPTGAKFVPAGSDSTSMMVVSGKLRVSKVARVQGAVAAALRAGASTPVAIMAMARTLKMRRIIRHLLLFVRWVEDLLQEMQARPILFRNGGHWF